MSSMLGGKYLPPAIYYFNTRPTHCETGDVIIPPVHNMVARTFGLCIYFVKICIGGSEKVRSHALLSYPL